MPEDVQETLGGETAKAPKKAKRTSNAQIAEKYDRILEMLESEAAKMDDLVMASGRICDTVRNAPDRGPGSAPEPARDMSQYMTSREQFEGYSKIMNRHDGEFADKQFVHLLEQLCTLREDFLKLCNGMQTKIDTFTAAEVLSSFRAYGVDIENMLTDAGVKFGTFTSPGAPVDTNRQRIVSVVPTTDPSKNGTVAQKMSNGYQYQGRTIVKEKVSVYRTSETQSKNRDH